MAAKGKIDPLSERITRLLAKKMTHERAILLIDIELAKLVHGGARNQVVHEEDEEEKTPETTAGADKSLDLLVHEIIVGKPMVLKDLVAEIRKRGYKTNSKNFVSCVQQAIHRLKHETVKAAKAVKDVHGRRYVGTKMSQELLKTRLSALSQSKRKARTDRYRSN